MTIMMNYLLLVVVAVAVNLFFCAQVATAQGCTNTCPPINFGVPVPSLCEGDNAANNDDNSSSIVNLDKNYATCGSIGATTTATRNNMINLRDYQGRIIVLSNFYIGCNAGRRESGVFAHVAQKYYNRYGGNNDQIVFISSLKGGPTCQAWADIYQRDAVAMFPDSGVYPMEMPLAILDQNYELRDEFFTTPFGHPSYVILDGNFTVRHKFIGPCCGYESYYDCNDDIAKSLDTQLSNYLDVLLDEAGATPQANDFKGGWTSAPSPPPASVSLLCLYGDFSEWSTCSVTCGSTPGIQFRWRAVILPEAARDDHTICEPPLETRPCTASEPICPDQQTGCVTSFGSTYKVQTVAEGFDGARDVAFHPSPGSHLGSYQEGRTFAPQVGEEAWVLNGHNHSFSIVASLGDSEHQTTLSRRDRGYYHYMINATAMAFNMVNESGRDPSRDSFGYWAVCNDNANTYLGTKEANNFMGPTLYNSSPKSGNLVNRLGEDCGVDEECFLLHADMLHEAPGCIGIAHDPETITSYGNVYWAFDSTGNQKNGQLVRFDFQQPHGPGSMDHSVAAVRRFPDVKLTRGQPGVHAGMAVHPETRELFIAVPGANKILAVHADSGMYARTAREEYPIYSNRLPSFEYSIWECTEQREFASGIDTPSGMALSADGVYLFVAERTSGNILVYEVSSGALVTQISTGYMTIGGMGISPLTGRLYFVDEDTNTLNTIVPTGACTAQFESRLSASFNASFEKAKQIVTNAGTVSLSLYQDYNCRVDPTVPDASFFDQVHEDTGYASVNPDVQSVMAGMDETAALLANRTDCGFDSELNFDQLLLGGYYCHQCLPNGSGAMCDPGGICRNVQWLGYVCDNEFVVLRSDTKLALQDTEGQPIDHSSLTLSPGVTYRFNIRGEALTVCAGDCAESSNATCASMGPLFVTPDDGEVVTLRAVGDGSSIALKTASGEKDDGLKRGVLVGIIVGSSIAFLILCLAMVIVTHKSKKNGEDTGEKKENSKEVSSDSTP